MSEESILNFYNSMDVDILIRTKLRKNSNVRNLARKISVKLGTSIFIVHDNYLYVKPIMFLNKESNPFMAIPLIQVLYKGYTFEPVVIVKNKNIRKIIEAYSDVFPIIDEDELYKDSDVFIVYVNK